MTTETFDTLIRLGAFAACGLVGLFASIAFATNQKFKYVVRYMFLSIIFGIISGVVSMKYITDDIEIALSISTICSMYTVGISKELGEIVSKLSDIVVGAANKKLDIKDTAEETANDKLHDS